MRPLDQKACDLGAELVRLWENWSDANEVESELAMRNRAKEIRALDLHQVDGVIASPLNYFVCAYMEDSNPEDLTISEMVDSLKVSLSIMQPVAPPYMSGLQIQNRFNPD